MPAWIDRIPTEKRTPGPAELRDHIAARNHDARAQQALLVQYRRYDAPMKQPYRADAAIETQRWLHRHILSGAPL